MIPQDFMKVSTHRAFARQCRGARSRADDHSNADGQPHHPAAGLRLNRRLPGRNGRYFSLTEEIFDDVDLSAKPLTAMVPVSNDLIRRAPVGVEAIVRDDLIQGISRREDLAFLRGDGSNKTPIGWRSLALPANILVIPVHGANPGGRSECGRLGPGGDEADLGQRHVADDQADLVFFAPTLIEFIRTRRDSVGSASTTRT